MTFLYELDRSHWSKYQRPFEEYLTRFTHLVHSSVPNLVVFADDPRVLEIARQGGATCILKSKEEWSSWNIEATRIALNKKRHRFNVPEFFSEEYICLQLCKADAILEALKTCTYSDTEPVFWIDAGIRSVPTSWEPVWTFPDKIHFFQIGPNIGNDFLNINTPMVHFAGGFLGGTIMNMKWFAESAQAMSSNLLKRGQCANDQQIFSMIHRRHPERFWGYTSYEVKTPLLFWYAPNFNPMYMVLQDAKQGRVKLSVQFHIQVTLAVLAIMLFYMRVSPTKSA